MSQFKLTARLRLETDHGSINRAVSDLRNSLNKTAASSVGVVAIGKSFQAAERSASSFGHAVQLSTRRMAAFVSGGLGVRALGQYFAGAVRSSIEFQTQMSKIAQVTGSSLKDVQRYGSELRNLGASIGVASSDLANGALELTAAGFSINQAIKLSGLAGRASLGASWGKDITKITDLMILLREQFKVTTFDDYERSLNSIANVSDKFASSAEDIIAAMSRAGSSFKGAGGNISEFTALVSTATATTRLSGESIGNSLKSISTRLMRMKNIKLAESLGIDLVEEGRFIGVAQAIERIADAGKKFNEGDVRFSGFLESIAGTHQIGVFKSIISNIDQYRDTLSVAQAEQNKIDKDAAKAQDTLANTIIKVREEIQKLSDAFVNSTGLSLFSKAVLLLTKSLGPMVLALGTALPLLATFKLAQRSIAKGTIAHSLFNQDKMVGVRKANDPLMIQPGRNERKAAARSAYYGNRNVSGVVGGMTGNPGAVIVDMLGKQFPNALLKSEFAIRNFTQAVKASWKSGAWKQGAGGAIGVGVMGASMAGAGNNSVGQGAIAAGSVLSAALLVGMNPFIAALGAGVLGILAWNDSLKENQRIRTSKSLDKSDKDLGASTRYSLVNPQSIKSLEDRLQAIYQERGKILEDTRNSIIGTALSQGWGEITGKPVELNKNRDDALAQLQGVVAGNIDTYKAMADEVFQTTQTFADFEKSVVGSRLIELFKEAGQSDFSSQMKKRFDKRNANLNTQAQINDPFRDLNHRLTMRFENVFEGLEHVGTQSFADAIAAMDLTEAQQVYARQINTAFMDLPKIMAKVPVNEHMEDILKDQLGNSRIADVFQDAIMSALEGKSLEERKQMMLDPEQAAIDLLRDLQIPMGKLASANDRLQRTLSKLSQDLESNARKREALADARNVLTSILDTSSMFAKRNAPGRSPFASNAAVLSDVADNAGTSNTRELIALAQKQLSELQNPTTIKGSDSYIKLSAGFKNSTEQLRKLTDVQKRLTSVTEEANRLESQKADKLGFAEQIARNPLEAARSLSMARAAQAGALTNAPPRVAEKMLDALDAIGDFKIPALGETGTEIKERALKGVGQKYGMSFEEDAQLDALKKLEAAVKDDAATAAQGLFNVAKAQLSIDTAEMSVANVNISAQKNVPNPEDWIGSGTGFARGGIVRGPAGRDKVPAMLTAGELVIPKDMVQYFANGGRVKTLEEIMREGGSKGMGMAGGMASGGFGSVGIRGDAESKKRLELTKAIKKTEAAPVSQSNLMTQADVNKIYARRDAENKLVADAIRSKPTTAQMEKKKQQNAPRVLGSKTLGELMAVYDIGVQGGNVAGHLMTGRSKQYAKRNKHWGLGSTTSFLGKGEISSAMNVGKIGTEVINTVFTFLGLDQMMRNGFARGGIVRGPQGRDKVPAMLTAGELVIPKNMVNRATKQQQRQTLTQTESNNNRATYGLTPQAMAALNNLATTIANMPRDITLTARHEVSVIINGAQLLAGLEPSIKNLIVAETNKAINHMLSVKFSLPPMS